jgi:hypothetical protein
MMTPLILLHTNHAADAAGHTTTTPLMLLDITTTPLMLLDTQNHDTADADGHTEPRHR